MDHMPSTTDVRQKEQNYYLGVINFQLENDFSVRSDFKIDTAKIQSMQCNICCNFFVQYRLHYFYTINIMWIM